MKQKILDKSQILSIQKTIQKSLEVSVSENENTELKLNIFVANKKSYEKEAFTLLFQSANLFLVKQLTPISAKLVLYFLSITQYDNKVDMDVLDMAKALNYSKKQLQRGINQLSDLKIISVQKSTKDGRRNIYIINPYQSWKGKETQRTIINNQFFPDNQLRLRFPESKNMKLPEGKVLQLNK